MLRRTGFAAKWAPRPAREWTGALPTARKVVSAIASVFQRTIVTPVPKENALQHAGYMAAVRKLPCVRCGTTILPRQFCHADEGKGERIKTDCRRGWPGCAHCHEFVGMTGRMSKAGRREFERFAGACTRAEIIFRGWWPKSLPLWEGS
jgi:hypothetical protein